jgi:hypothetical protein
MTDSLDSILEECLLRVRAGKATREDCLARYPQAAGELGPLLVAAERLWAVPKPRLAEEAKARIEAQLLAAVGARKASGASKAGARRPGAVWGRWRLASVGLSLLVAVLLLTTVLVGTVGESRPGSPVRQVAEATWLWLAPSPAKPNVHLQYAQRRWQEVAALTEKGAVDLSAVDRMTQQTEAALQGAEQLPPDRAVPVVENLVVLIQEQQQTLGLLLDRADPASREGVAAALQAAEEQAVRTRTLMRALPMPPRIVVSQEATPSSLPEPGGPVRFGVRAVNDGVQAVAIVALSSDLLGDLAAQGSCRLPGEGIRLQPDELYACAYEVLVQGKGGETVGERVTVVAVDGEGNRAQAAAAAEVLVTDVLPRIELSKVAVPSTVPEPGGLVEFTLRVTNRSVEAVTVTDLVDDMRGNLNGRGTCALPEGGLPLAVGSSYECTFSAEIRGNAGERKTNTAAAAAVDDEGNRVKASAGATVTISDVLPAIGVLKTPRPSSVPEPGGAVQYSLVVRNECQEEVWIRSLVDDQLGDLSGQGSCFLPAGGAQVSPGRSYECAFSARVTGNAGAVLRTATTVTAVDDEGNQVKAVGRAAVTVTDVLPSIRLGLSPANSMIPEPGAQVRFTVRLTNESVEEVALVSLVHSSLGNLNGLGTCALPTAGLTLRVGGSYECAFPVPVRGNAGETRNFVITAAALDDEGNRAEASARATVTLQDVLPVVSVRQVASVSEVPEPAGEVRFTVTVNNHSVEPVFVTALVDDVYGNLNGRGNCALPAGGQPIPVGGTYECTYVDVVAGNAGQRKTNVVTVVAVDDEKNSVKAAGSSGVVISDVLPVIAVTKTASPTSVPEPGGRVEFTVRVTNRSVEEVLLRTLVDDKHGNLNGRGSCALPPGGLKLASGWPATTGESYTCTYQAEVTGNAFERQVSTVTAVAADDEGNQVKAAASASVTLSDVLPVLAVTQTARPTEVPEPGAPVEFSVRVRNDSVEPVLLTSLQGDLHGNLNGRGTCSLPVGGLAMAVGGSYSCTYSAQVTGNAAERVTSTVTALAKDDEGNVAQATASATVTLLDVLPSARVTVTANPSGVDEPGGYTQLTVVVENLSVEDVLLTSLASSVHGNLNGRGSCAVPAAGTAIKRGASYQCSYTPWVAGNAGDRQTHTVTAAVADDEANVAKATGSVTVRVLDVLPAIALSAAASPGSLPAPGGTAQFSVRVTNVGVEDVVLSSLLSSAHGDLNGRGTCSLPAGGRVLAPQATYACAFSGPVSGGAGQEWTTTFTAQASDDEGNQVEASAGAAVRIVAAPLVRKTASRSSVPEPGGLVEFRIEVTNSLDRGVQLVSLGDDLYGDLSGRGSCSLPAGGRSLSAGETYACAFGAEVRGNAGNQETSTVTAVIDDGLGNRGQASASTTVTVSDELPVASLSTTASPDSLPEPGGVVQFTVRVTNGGREDLVLLSLVDDLFGDLNGQGTCSLGNGGRPIVAGSTYECTFSGPVAGNGGDRHTNTVTGLVTDDEGNRVAVSGSATVLILDVPPEIGVEKTATPGEVTEPGALVTFSLQVSNRTAEPVFLQSLVDDVYGDLNGLGSCSLPAGGLSLAGYGSYACSFVAQVSGAAGEGVTNTVTAVAFDDEGNRAQASASATVTILAGAGVSPQGVSFAAIWR